MDDLKSGPAGSIGDAMPSTGGTTGQKMNVTDEWKKKKAKTECAMDAMKPGFNKTIPEETEKSFDAEKNSQMSINQLKSIMHNTAELLAMIKKDDLLPEWVETKITLAEDYMVTCSNFLRSAKDE